MEITVVKGLRYNSGISIDWTSEEESALEYLIQKYASKAPIVYYASIAQALSKKNIRDVVFYITCMRDKKNGERVNLFGAKILSYKPRVEGSGAGLIEHNARVLDEIETNFLDPEKFHENIDLLSQARDNILTILNGMPKKFHDRMPPFPFKLHQQLSDFVLPPKSHPKN